MGDFVQRLTTPSGTDVSGSKTPPQPVTRADPSLDDAAKKRRAAAALRMGTGATRLTSGLGETSGSNRVSLLGNIGS